MKDAHQKSLVHPVYNSSLRAYVLVAGPTVEGTPSADVVSPSKLSMNQSAR